VLIKFTKFFVKFKTI